jgi:alpha/beta superfamily hydrolase
MHVDLLGPAGRIEGLLESPPSPRFAALVLHPHPLFGGTMHNHATYQLARAARMAGGASLRIQFRGVGLSEGTHSGGPGELADARAALLWLSGRLPALPLFLGGMSFGSWIALRLGCADPEVQGVLAVGLASRTLELGFLPDCPRRVAAVQAAADEFGSVGEVTRLMAGPPDRRRLAVIEGATHLFLEDLPALQREAAAAWDWLAGPR